jgi:hypothetical protein
MKLLPFIIALSLTSPVFADIDWGRFTKALAATETGGEKNPDAAIGDGTAARGKLQVHFACWKDACEYDPSLKTGTYMDCHKSEYADRVCKAYLSRYGKDAIKAGDVGKLARLWNGGCRGWSRAATLPYMEKFLKHWKRLS